jgi:hypothetical protein
MGAGLAIFSGITGLIGGGLQGRTQRQLAELEAEEAKTRQTTIIVAASIFALIVVMVAVVLIKKK